jgi:hypothetical protein
MNWKLFWDILDIGLICFFIGRYCYKSHQIDKHYKSVYVSTDKLVYLVDEKTTALIFAWSNIIVWYITRQ